MERISEPYSSFPPTWSHGAYRALETDKQALADVLVSKAEPKPGYQQVHILVLNFRTSKVTDQPKTRLGARNQ